MSYMPTVSTEAMKFIKSYCEKRHYKCRGCRYSIKYIIPEYQGHMCCVFADCPCDWDMKEKE